MVAPGDVFKAFLWIVVGRNSGSSKRTLHNLSLEVREAPGIGRSCSQF